MRPARTSIIDNVASAGRGVTKDFSAGGTCVVRLARLPGRHAGVEVGVGHSTRTERRFSPSLLWRRSESSGRTVEGCSLHSGARDEPGELVIPAPVTAEVDYLLGRRLGRRAQLAFLDDLAVGRFTVAGLEAEDYRLVLNLERRYEDVDAGLADLNAVVVAGRCRTRRLLTFDERHFRALPPLDGGHFTLLPAEAAML